MKEADSAPDAAGWLLGELTLGGETVLEVELGGAVVVLAAAVDDVVPAGAVVAVVEVGLVVVDVEVVDDVVDGLVVVVDGANAVVVTTVVVTVVVVLDVAAMVVAAASVVVVAATDAVGAVEVVESEVVDCATSVVGVAAGIAGGLTSASTSAGSSSRAGVWVEAATGGEVPARTAVIETASPICVRIVVAPSTTVGGVGMVVGTITRRFPFGGDPNPHALKRIRTANDCERFPRRWGVALPAITGTVPDKAPFCHP